MSTATTTQSTASPGGPRVSKFAAKSGFVIPKNKLSGSLVPVFKGGKKPESNDEASAGTEESVNKVKRKTKWGPDLTQDAAVGKGRALAYQTRVDQIAQQLKSGALQVEDNQDTQISAQHDDQSLTNPQVGREKLEVLEFEKREVIGEILKLNPSYNAPAGYKPLLKEAIVPIPVKEYRGYNFLGLIFGPASDTQKRLEKETGAMIQVYGTKADTGEKVEISPSDGNVQSTYEELHMHISADTYEKVDAAADLVELLVTSVRENLAAISTSTLVSGENVNVLGQGQDEGNIFMVPTAVVDQGVAQKVVGPMQNPQGQFQYQSPWFPSGSPQTSMPPLNSSASVLTNPVNMPSLFGPRPTTATGFTPMFQNPSLVSPNSQPSLQVPPRPYMPQIHPSGYTGPPRNFLMPPLQPSSAQPNISVPLPFTGSQPQPMASLPVGRPLIPSLPQAVSNIPPRPLPDHLLTPKGGSSGWSGAPANAQASLGLTNMGQLGPGIIPPQGLRPVVSQTGVASSAPSKMSAGNMVSPPSFPSGLSPTQSSGTALNHPAGPVFASGPPPQVGPFPAFPASAAVQPSPLGPVASSGPSISPQSLQAGILNSVSRSTANFSTINPSSATTSRPQNPSSGDFTFQPHRPQNLAPLTVPRPSSQPAMLNTPPSRPMTQLPSPQASSFLLAGPNAAQLVRQFFPRPQVGNQMGQSQVHMSSVTFARNPNAPFANVSPVAPTTPVSQMGPRNFGTGPQVPNLAGPFPPRPGNLLQLQQNFPALRNRPENRMGVNQHLNNNPSFSSDKLAPGPRGLHIYDPFSPTSASMPPQQQGGNPAARARKQENDPEYEDLMASVGVK